MTDSQDTDRTAQIDASPDIYTLEIPADGYVDIRQTVKGRLQIEQTPEQREEFLDWIRTEVLRNV